jgi:hypothetical protein
MKSKVHPIDCICTNCEFKRDERFKEIDKDIHKEFVDDEAELIKQLRETNEQLDKGV